MMVLSQACGSRPDEVTTPKEALLRVIISAAADSSKLVAMERLLKALQEYDVEFMPTQLHVIVREALSSVTMRIRALVLS
mmetsp:Transcript_36301/g.54187  ORF Transcript_36301/g.54187 Transcript_36301/m.54187 type:complete len:80 (-) Transcript_36301:4-243(-)